MAADHHHLLLTPNTPHPMFSPFTRVLVRNTDQSTWKASIFDHYSEGNAFPFVTINKNYWRQCIAYEGNEHLHGTKTAPYVKP